MWFAATLVVLKLYFEVVNGQSQQDKPPPDTYTIAVFVDGGMSEEQQQHVINYLNVSVACLSQCKNLGADWHPPDKQSPPAQLELDLVDLTPTPTDTSETLLQKMCESLSSTEASVGLSLLTDGRAVQAMQQLAATSRLPVIQLHTDHWTYAALLNDTIAPLAENEPTAEVSTPDYVSVVPAQTVYSNLVLDFARAANLTDRFALLYEALEEKYVDPLYYIDQTGVPYDRIDITGRDPSSLSAVMSAVAGLQPQPSVVLVVATTKTLEQLTAHATDTIAAETYRWMALSLDVMSFSCLDCPQVRLLLAQPDRKDEAFNIYTRMEQYKKLIDVMYKKGTLPSNMTVNSENELYVSFYLDSVFLAWQRLVSAGHPPVAYSCAGSDGQRSNSTTSTAMRMTNTTASLQDIVDEWPMASLASYTRDTQSGCSVKGSDFQSGNVFRSDRLQLTGASSTYYMSVLGKVIGFFRQNNWQISKAVGNWTALTGVEEEYDTLLQDVRNINIYKVVVVTKAPFVMKTIDPETGAVIWTGYCIDLIEKIAEKLRSEITFNYELYEAPDGAYGTIDDHEVWNGMIGELVAGEADIALGALSVMAERENYIDFTVPYYDLVGTTILMKKQTSSTNLFEFVHVLELPVWLCIVGAYFFTSFLLWVFDRYSPYSYTNNREKYRDDPEKREFTFKECLWFCLTSLTPQGGGEAPKNISGRLVAATWWLFGFIIIASYTANLAAFLTVSRLEVQIKSLDDLANQWKIKYSPAAGTAHETYFKRMAEIESKFYDLWKEMSLNKSMDAKERAKLAVWDYPVSDKFTNMWRFMEQSGLPSSVDAAIGRVLNSSSNSREGQQYAYIGWYGDATDIKYAEMTNCELMRVGSEFSRKPYAIAVQQGSHLKNRISKAILHLLNERKLEQLREDWWMNNPAKKNCPKETNDSEGISIKSIGGVFIVILGGIVLSIFILIFEYFYYKNKPEKLQKKGDTAGEWTSKKPKQISNGQTQQLPNGEAFDALGTQYNINFNQTHDELSVPGSVGLNGTAATNGGLHEPRMRNGSLIHNGSLNNGVYENDAFKDI